jgi:Zn-dependent alcohol dehydrogenase
MGRHKARTDLGVEFGATDVVAERGEEGVAKVMELTGGEGSHIALEAAMDAREALRVLVKPQARTKKNEKRNASWSTPASGTRG